MNKSRVFGYALGFSKEVLVHFLPVIPAARDVFFLNAIRLTNKLRIANDGEGEYVEEFTEQERKSLLADHSRAEIIISEIAKIVALTMLIFNVDFFPDAVAYGMYGSLAARQALVVTNAILRNKNLVDGNGEQ